MTKTVFGDVNIKMSTKAVNGEFAVELAFQGPIAYKGKMFLRDVAELMAGIQFIECTDNAIATLMVDQTIVPDGVAAAVDSYLEKINEEVQDKKPEEVQALRSFDLAAATEKSIYGALDGTYGMESQRA